MSRRSSVAILAAAILLGLVAAVVFLASRHDLVSQQPIRFAAPNFGSSLDSVTPSAKKPIDSAASSSSLESAGPSTTNTATWASSSLRIMTEAPGVGAPNPVRVVSVGGMGTTFFMKWFVKNAPNLLTDNYGDYYHLKHSTVYHGEKVLYLVGEPRHSIKSHYRRHWGQLQMSKLGTASREAIQTCSTLEKYISLASSRHEDLFGIKKHFEIWSSRDNVLVTSLESIKVDPEPVTQFMNIDPTFLDSIREEIRPSGAAPEFGAALDPLYDALWDEEQRWAFGYRPERCRSQSKRFVYLILSQKMQSSYEAMEWCANEDASCDVLVLTWGEDTTSYGENHIAAPGIQWAAGRNLLLKAAMERNDYEYYTFVAEEVTLVPMEQCSQSRPEGNEPFMAAYRCSQDFLESRRPVVAYTATTKEDAAVTAHFFFDAAFNSYHRSATAILLPYIEDADTVYCQYVMNLLAGMFINKGRVSYPGLIASYKQNNVVGGGELRAFNSSSYSMAVSMIAEALSPLGTERLCQSIPSPELSYDDGAPVGLSRSEQPPEMDSNPFGSSPPPVLSEAQVSRVFYSNHSLAERTIAFRRSIPVACALHASQAEHGQFASLSIESAKFADDRNGCLTKAKTTRRANDN